MLTRYTGGNSLRRSFRISLNLLKTRSLTTNSSRYLPSLNLPTKIHRIPFSISTKRFSSVVQFKLADIGEGIREVEVKEWFAILSLLSFLH